MDTFLVVSWLQPLTVRSLQEPEAVQISFDSDKRVSTSSIEPADLGLFDHVLKTALLAFDALRLP